MKKQVNTLRFAALSLLISAALTTQALELNSVVGHEQVSVAAEQSARFKLPLHRIAAYEGKVTAVNGATLNGDFPVLPNAAMYVHVVTESSSAYGKLARINQHSPSALNLAKVLPGLAAGDRIVVRQYSSLADLSASATFTAGTTLTLDPAGTAQTFTWSASASVWQDASNADASAVLIEPAMDLELNNPASTAASLRLVGELVTSPWHN